MIEQLKKYTWKQYALAATFIGLTLILWNNSIWTVVIILALILILLGLAFSMHLSYIIMVVVYNVYTSIRGNNRTLEEDLETYNIWAALGRFIDEKTK